MGRITDSIIAGTSGRTGRVVVANIDGIEISKIRPKRTTKPPSAKQNLVTQRFNQAVIFIGSYKEYAKRFYGTRSKMKSSYNQAMSSVMKGLTLDMDNLTIIPLYNHIQFSKGIGIRPLPMAISSPAASKIQIDWDNNASGTDAENDYLVILLAEDEELDSETIFLEPTVQRKDLSYTFSVLPRYQNKEMHVWIAFVNEDNLFASNSTYIGSILIT